MPGNTYGGSTGGQYGTANGGQYGDTQFGTRVDLFEPGEIGPTLSLNSVSQVSIGLEHTALSDMEISLPPHNEITIDRFRSGEMAYYRNDRLLFRSEIEGVDVDDDYTLTLPGTAVEDIPLIQNEISRSFSDTTIATAIESVAEELPVDVRVKPTPERPIEAKVVQTADVGTGFKELLTAGDSIDYNDRSTWRDIPGSIGDDDVINTLHETTPLKITIDGLTITKTCKVVEAEDFSDSAGISVVSDTDASGGSAVEIVDVDDYIELDFSHEHTIPAGFCGVSVRGRVSAFGTSSTDRVAVSVDGTTESEPNSNHAWGSADYFWRHRTATVSSSVDAVDEGDDPHTVRIEKVEGDDTLRIDCVAIHDLRYNHPASGYTTVDSDNALSEPGLYPHNVPAVFDIAPTGAILNHAGLDVSLEWRGETSVGTIGFLVPATDTAHIGGTLVDREGEEGLVVFEADIDESAQTSQVLFHVDPAGTTLTGDNKPTTTPTERTEAQTVTNVEAGIWGYEEPVIAGEREFQGTPLSVLKTLHEDSGRRFNVEHGVTPDSSLPIFRSYEARDSDENRTAANWIVTDVSRDSDVSDYANHVTVIGAPLAPGSAARARATAKDQDAIDSLANPPDDDGVRPITIEDDSLETVNDCLSKARAILRDRVNADKRGGSVTTVPILPVPGPQYLTDFFGAETVGGWGNDWGLSWGASRDGYRSALEAVSFTEKSGSAKTELEFERYHSVYQAVTEFRGE